LIAALSVLKTSSWTPESGQIPDADIWRGAFVMVKNHGGDEMMEAAENGPVPTYDRRCCIVRCHGLLAVVLSTLPVSE
jgi:hypothetical protein